MYQHFNPLALTDAWWQHLLMLLVSAILGYIIGYRSRRSRIEALEATLATLDSDLDNCLRAKKTTTPVAARIEAPVVVETLAPTPTPVAVAATPPKPDDLKVVEGIGPAIEKLFNNAEIWTFAQLADTAPERLKEILVAAGSRFQMHDPTTWPHQSALARDGKWDELKALQDLLNKGRTE